MAEEVKAFNGLLSKKIKELTPVQTVWVRVDEVNWEEKTMTATGITDDLPFYDVLLGVGNEYHKPKKGTKALIGLIDNTPNNSFLITADEVEEVNIKTGNSFLTIKENGFIVKQGTESLRTILNDFMNEVNKIIVVNGTSINVGAVNAIKQRLNSVLIE